MSSKLNAKSKKKREKERDGRAGGRTARPLAPEDIAPGMYVVALKRVCEIPALFMCDVEPWQREEVLRIEMVPTEHAAPARVVSVCLPFVVVRNAKGEREVIDVRLARLAGVTEEFARAARRTEVGRGE